MYHRILVPTDGSDGTERAVEHAIALAADLDAGLDVLHVTDTSNYPLDGHSRQFLRAAERAGDESLREVIERARERGVDRVTATVRQGVPYRMILDYVDETDVDLVVMGTHGRRGLDRFLLGSTTERVVRGADVTVLSVPMTASGSDRRARRSRARSLDG